jgi:rubrerythrin
MRSSLRRHLVPATTAVPAANLLLAKGRAAAVEAPPIPRPAEMSWHDTAVYLLHVASEIEHALMVQYLYAAYSLGGANVPQETHEKARAWREVILGIAKEEMGHLLTVQNILRLIGGPLHLERDDYPFRSEFYSFRFKLEPLTKDSLAKYVVAESPKDWIDSADAKEIVDRAKKADDERPVLRVGVLYQTLIDLFKDRDALPNSTFLRATEPYQASWDEWGRGYGSGDRGNIGGESPHTTPDLLIRRVRDRASTVDALEAIARQGEAPDPAATLTRAEMDQSHFARFLNIYNDFPKTDPPSRHVPTNPTTDPEAQTERSPITNETSLTWAHLFNVRYRKLLYSLKHAFFVPAGADLRRPTSRGDLIAWTFGEMYNLRTIAGTLVTLPRTAAGGDDLAGPPFEVAYTLSLPDWDSDKWRIHRDLIEASASLIDELEDASPTQLTYLHALRAHDKHELAIVEGLLDAALAQEAAS